jgi:hypothetical protein
MKDWKASGLYAIAGMFFLLLPLKVISQELGVIAGGGFSKMNEKRDGIYDYFTINSYYKSSFTLGLYYEYLFSNKFLGVMSTVNFYQSKSLFASIPVSPQVTFYNNFVNIYSLMYLSFPAYFGFKIKKIALYVGMKPSMNIFTNSKSHGFSIDSLNTVYEFNYKSKNLPIKHLDFGGIIGFQYKLKPKLNIVLQYYFGLINIFESNISNYDWHLSQCVLGLKFELGNLYPVRSG